MIGKESWSKASNDFLFLFLRGRTGELERKSCGLGEVNLEDLYSSILLIGFFSQILPSVSIRGSVPEQHHHHQEQQHNTPWNPT